MASWPGTAATTICMLTLRSRSVNGLTQVRPGSRVPGSARPKRKTMPFSYEVMILKPNIAAVLSPRLGAGLAESGDVTSRVRIALGFRFDYCTPGDLVRTPVPGDREGRNARDRRGGGPRRHGCRASRERQ